MRRARAMTLRDTISSLVLLVMICNKKSLAFVSTQPLNHWGQLLQKTLTSSRHWAYRDDNFGGSGGDTPANLKKTRRSQHVPLLGPIPGGAPLLVGGEMLLDHPTPLQWQALEESVLLHREYLIQQQQNATTTTGVDAAPLVAVIDNVTGKRVSKQGRYATLAAVVGISQSSKHERKLSTLDQTDFMESLSLINSERSPLSSCVRLVGIGRAKLRDYFYKLPTVAESSTDADGQQEIKGDVGELEDIDDEEEVEISEDPPIFMAEFDLLEDTDRVSGGDDAMLGTKGARSAHMSPVHALAEMSKISNRLMRLHEHRRRLVRGCSAAKARLEQTNFFEDHDGIGQLSSGIDDQEIIEDLLSRYDDELPILPSVDNSVLLSMENYGLGYFSAFSSILDLTQVAKQKLEPYYSPSRRAEEEFHIEVMSFVAFRSLEGFCSSQDLAWALECTNSIDRLTRAYDIMYRHAQLLEGMAQQMSHDLRECGEECTDLW